MKKTILALFLCCILSLPAFAQNQRIRMSGGSVTVQKLFSEIESQTGLSVDYDASKVDLGKSVRTDPGNTTVKELLDSTLDGAGYSYTIRGCPR